MTTIGTDTEFFLRDARTGSVIPAVGLLGGTKRRPRQMEGLAEGYAIQEDNVMGEFNIPPVSGGDSFINAIVNAKDYITQWVEDNVPNAELYGGECTRLFGPGHLISRQAKNFGCSPDFNAYAEGAAAPPVLPQQLRPPEDTQGAEWRCAGGHIHLGYTGEVPAWVAARYCDLYLALPSTALDRQGVRRALYGQPGRYRPKAYGIEYRTLSNFWMWSDRTAEELGYRAYRLALLLSDKVSIATLSKAYAEIPWPEVQKSIAEEDANRATDILSFCFEELNVPGVMDS